MFVIAPYLSAEKKPVWFTLSKMTNGYNTIASLS